MRYYGILLYTIILLQSCNGKTLPSGFDSVSWINDQNGCLGERSAMWDQVQRIQPELRGLGREELTSILGKPDATELYSRGQLIYRYRITPSDACRTMADEGATRILEVRLNSLGVVSEANIMLFNKPATKAKDE